MKLEKGQNAVVVDRKGNMIGNSYMHRRLASVAIVKPDGKFVHKRTRYGGHTPYWIANTDTFASHYKTGMSNRDCRRYRSQVEELYDIAGQINKEREV